MTAGEYVTYAAAAQGPKVLVTAWIPKPGYVVPGNVIPVVTPPATPATSPTQMIAGRRYRLALTSPAIALAALDIDVPTAQHAIDNAAPGAATVVSAGISGSTITIVMDMHQTINEPTALMGVQIPASAMVLTDLGPSPAPPGVVVPTVVTPPASALPAWDPSAFEPWQGALPADVVTRAKYWLTNNLRYNGPPQTAPASAVRVEKTADGRVVAYVAVNWGSGANVVAWQPKP
jgi:hypothetical protein